MPKEDFNVVTPRKVARGILEMIIGTLVVTMVFGAIAIIALFVALHSAVPFANANGIGTINSDAGKFVISVYITLATAFIIYLLRLLKSRL